LLAVEGDIGAGLNDTGGDPLLDDRLICAGEAVDAGLSVADRADDGEAREITVVLGRPISR